MTVFDRVRILLCLIFCTVQDKCQSRFKPNMNAGSHIFYSPNGSSGRTRMTESSTLSYCSSHGHVNCVLRYLCVLVLSSGIKMFWTSGPLRMGAILCPETSVTNQPNRHNS